VSARGRFGRSVTKEIVMRTRVLLSAALLGLLAVPGLPRAAEPKSAGPTVVLRVKSLDGILDDFAYVARAAGKEEEAKQLQKMVLAQAGAKGLKGIDRTKPLGLYATVGKTAGESTAVGLIPVADEDAILALLDNLNLKAEKGDDGLYTVTSDKSPAPVYFRFANGYAYVTVQNKDALDKAGLPAPGEVLPAGENALLSLTAHLDRVPEPLKKLFLEQMQDKVDEGKKQRDPMETDAQHAVKEETADELAGVIAAVVKDGRALEARIDVDRTADELVAELSLDALPKTDLAGTIHNLAGVKSLFAGLAGRHAAFDVQARLAVPQRGLKVLGEALDEQARKELLKETDKAKREQGEKLLKALLPTFKAGELDVGVSIRGPAADKTYTVVGGMKVKDGEGINKAVRDLVAGLPEDKRKEVHFDAAKAGSVAIHKVDVSDPDAKTRDAFGPNAEGYFAFRPDALVFAVGGNALAAVKEAVALEPKPGAPFLLDMELARMAPLMEHDNPGAVKAAEDAFRTGRDADRLHIGLEGGKALRLSARITPQAVLFFSQVKEGAKGEKP
jgi:hypothetical protein